MEKDPFIYAVTRIHAREQQLLSDADIAALRDAPSAAAAFELLAAKGWSIPAAPPSIASAEEIVRAEEERAWLLMEELAGSAPFLEILRLPRDFHNVKAALKLQFAVDPPEARHCFVGHGTTAPDTIRAAVSSKDYSSLPEVLRGPLTEAREVLTSTGSAQESDMALDRACYEALDKRKRAYGGSLIGQVCDIRCDCANILGVLRMAAIGADRARMDRLAARAGSLDVSGLLDAAADGENDPVGRVQAFLHATPYDADSQLLSKSLAEFQASCERKIIGLIKPYRYVYSTADPLYAWMTGKLEELRCVRLILIGSIAGFGADAALARSAPMYR